MGFSSQTPAVSGRVRPHCSGWATAGDTASLGVTCSRAKEYSGECCGFPSLLFIHFLPVVVDTQTLQGVKRSQKIRWIAHLTETRLTIFHDFVLKFWVLNWLFCMCHRGQSLLSCGGWVASGRPCPSSEVVGAVGVQTLGRGAMHRFSLWLLSNLKSNEDRSVSMSISVPVGGVRLTSAEF